VLDPTSLLADDTPAVSAETIAAVPRETFWAFVVAFLSAQTALAATSLGLLFVGFRGRVVLGGILVAVGVGAFVLTVALYRWHQSVVASV